MSNYDVHNLGDVIGDGVVVKEEGNDISVEWDDGSSAELYYDEEEGWCFYEDEKEEVSVQSARSVLLSSPMIKAYLAQKQQV